MISEKAAKKILLSPASRLFIEERRNKTIAIGVPHHAPAGISRLPCPDHIYSDENTGFLGRYLAEELECSSIIACNAWVDGNKSMESIYSKQLVKWDIKLLIEVHGHKRRRTNNDVEISCGSVERNVHSMKLAQGILAKCQKDRKLKWLKICGDFNSIYFKARTAKTITYKGWMAYLIELAPELRFKRNQIGGTPPQLGYIFCNCLLESLSEAGAI